MSSRYDELEEPTFGTVLHDGGEKSLKLIYVFAPRNGDDPRPWATSYKDRTRFSSADVWRRAKDPKDMCRIIYDPRVDYE